MQEHGAPAVAIGATQTRRVVHFFFTDVSASLAGIEIPLPIRW